MVCYDTVVLILAVLQASEECLDREALLFFADIAAAKSVRAQMPFACNRTPQLQDAQTNHSFAGDKSSRDAGHLLTSTDAEFTLTS